MRSTVTAGLRRALLDFDCSEVGLESFFLKIPIMAEKAYRSNDGLSTAGVMQEPIG